MNPSLPPDHDPFNTRRPVVHELKWTRKLLFYPLAWGLRALFFTWRMDLSPRERELLEQHPAPRLIVAWHNRSLVMPEVLRRFFQPERIACLISPSKLAAWEVAFFKLFRLRVVRGSTTRRSIHATRELFRELRSGGEVGISPDGPSGPLYHFQSGAVAIARKTRKPLLFICPNARAAWRPRTWDRHLVPLPFARIRIDLKIILPDDPIWDLDNAAASAELQRLCLEITEDLFHPPANE